MRFEILVFLLTFWLFPFSLHASPDSYFLGSSKADITPSSGTPLAGYGRYRGKPTRGHHDPLFVRALALSHDDQTFLFVSADLVLIDEELRSEILKKIKSKAPFNEEQLILTATHTHTGAGAIGGRFWERFIMGKFQKDVFETITNKIAQAALEALNEKIPVVPEYAETRIDEMIENRMDEKLRFPAKLKVLRFKKENGAVAGTMLFMAAHPTMAPAAEGLFSADFPGVLSEKLEKAHPETIALFINGAAADLRPHTEHFEDRFERLKVYGNSLAEKVLKLPFSSASLEGPWRSAIQRVRLPRTQIRLGWFKVPSLLGNRVFPTKTYFQALRMGKFLFVTFPGEASAEIGFEVEKAALSRSFTPFFVGYAHDFIGYMVPRRYYRGRRQYESQVSFYGETLEWFFQEKAGALMDLLLTEKEKKVIYAPAELQKHNEISVLRVSGNVYHAGYEEGRLLKADIQKGVDEIYTYFRKELPIPLLNRLVIAVIANRAWKQMEPHLTYEEYLSIKALAEGAEVSFKKLKQIHAMPEIYPALCANGAYWGKATAEGNLIAIRNLDWNRQMGIHRHAAVKWVQIAGRQAYANIGYVGFAGVLSGMNEKGISVGQIGAISSDETMKGTPMPFMLKRILENASSLEDIDAMFQRYSRTRGYNYVFSDALNRRAMAVEATAHHVSVFWENDPRESAIPYALTLENAVFRADPALDPEIRNLQTASGGDPKKKGLEFPKGSAYEIRYLKHGQLIKTHYGKITPDIARSIAKEIAPGSNIQSVVYSYPEFFVANAKDNLRAVDTSYSAFSFSDLRDKSS